MVLLALLPTASIHFCLYIIAALYLFIVDSRSTITTVWCLYICWQWHYSACFPFLWLQIIIASIRVTCSASFYRHMYHCFIGNIFSSDGHIIFYYWRSLVLTTHRVHSVIYKRFVVIILVVIYSLPLPLNSLRYKLSKSKLILVVLLFQKPRPNDNPFLECY